jgi:diguanylate cyclase (GGDEF)-like protein
MLSESIPSRGAGTPPIAPLLYAQGKRVSGGGLAAGGALIALAAIARAFLPAALPSDLVAFAGVVIGAWYGGPQGGTTVAIAAAAARLVVDVLMSADPIGVPVAGAALTFALSMLAARALPAARKALERERETAITDPLTGLGNRRFFREIAGVELNRTRRYKRPLVLVYVDVDGFDGINDRVGYAEGDLLLSRIAATMTAGLRTSDVVARIAADEFAILLPETPGEGGRVVVEKLLARIAQDMTASGDEITFSIAGVGYEDGPVTLEAVLRQADAIMSGIKERGGDAVLFEEYAHPAVTLI